MSRNWTFGQKVGAGFTLMVVLALVIGTVAIYALQTVVATKDQVLNVNAQTVMEAQLLSANSARRMGNALRYIISPSVEEIGRIRELRSDMLANIGHLRETLGATDRKGLIDEIEKREVDMHEAIDRVIAMRETGAPLEAVTRAYDDEVGPKRVLIRDAIDKLVAKETEILQANQLDSTRTAASAITLVMGLAAIAVVIAIALALLLTRALSQQIGTAVGQMQSSSAELQAAANQQAAGAKEQASAMSEITTTISELLATSRQIAESAQRVAQIAEQTASAARSGDGTVEKGHEAVRSIQRQVDLIVNHMLELGKKSQQIGAVLDIVAELAEQTNILAINATIEAAGAGESGKRFAVVAEEIRKLADRVGGSTKEIRGLIDDVRSAVNTTVMTTETGSKAVEAGAKQFPEVAAAFKQIAGLVATTTEAAREIELSTKQQTTAVEQVNIAVTNVAQASKENEASTSQTLQTSSQLTGLARELLRLVQPQATPLAHHDLEGRTG